MGRVKGGSATFFSFLSSRARAGSARQGQVVMGLPGGAAGWWGGSGWGALMAGREERERLGLGLQLEGVWLGLGLRGW